LQIGCKKRDIDWVLIGGCRGANFTYVVKTIKNYGI